MNSFTNQRGRNNKAPQHKGERCNEAIRVPEVLVIGEAGQPMGTMLTSEALQYARNAGLDLVEVAPEAKPPVCRVMDFGKRKYEEQKKKQEAKKRQTVTQLKEIRFRPKTDKGDRDTKLRHIIRFLEDGDKCKVSVVFRGRESRNKEKAEQLLAGIIEETKEIGKVEQAPTLEGQSLAILLVPLKK